MRRSSPKQQKCKNLWIYVCVCACAEARLLARALRAHQPGFATGGRWRPGLETVLGRPLVVQTGRQDIFYSSC